MKAVQLIEVDKDPNLSHYLFKEPSLHNKKVFIGTDSGDIIIYDLINNIEIKIKASNNAVISKVHNYNNSYYFGTEDGRIFILNKVE